MTRNAGHDEHELHADPQLDALIDTVALAYVSSVYQLNPQQARAEVARRGTRLVWNRPRGCVMCGKPISRMAACDLESRRQTGQESSAPPPAAPSSKLMIYGLCRAHLRKDHQSHEPCAGWHWHVAQPNLSGLPMRKLVTTRYPVYPLLEGAPEIKTTSAYIMQVPISNLTVIRNKDGSVNLASKAVASKASLPVFEADD